MREVDILYGYIKDVAELLHHESTCQSEWPQTMWPDRTEPKCNCKLGILKQRLNGGASEPHSIPKEDSLPLTFREKVSILYMDCNADINHIGEIKQENKKRIWRLLDDACNRLEGVKQLQEQLAQTEEVLNNQADIELKLRPKLVEYEKQLAEKDKKISELTAEIERLKKTLQDEAYQSGE